jgi:hypothetical protein
MSAEQVGPDWWQVCTACIFVETWAMYSYADGLFDSSFKPSGFNCKHLGVFQVDIVSWLVMMQVF